MYPASEKEKVARGGIWTEGKERKGRRRTAKVRGSRWKHGAWLDLQPFTLVHWQQASGIRSNAIDRSELIQKVLGLDGYKSRFPFASKSKTRSKSLLSRVKSFPRAEWRWSGTIKSRYVNWPAEWRCGLEINLPQKDGIAAPITKAHNSRDMRDSLGCDSRLRESLLPLTGSSMIHTDPTDRARFQAVSNFDRVLRERL